MTIRSAVLILSALGYLTFASVKTYGDMEVGVGVQIHTAADFNGPLAAEGAWVDYPSYGHCWHPAHVAADWRPYCDGSWVWTDAGWYWESDEPWAWACYHYGSWTYDPDEGWIWIPDIEWAPAWVYWRTGGDHVGWAPCPPHGRSVPDAQFVFVDTAHFQDRVRPSSVVINDATLIRGTKLITKVSRSTVNIPGVGRQTVVVNKGPGVGAIQKATGKKFEPISIHDAAGRTQMPDRPQQRVASPAPAEPGPKQPELMEKSSAPDFHQHSEPREIQPTPQPPPPQPVPPEPREPEQRRPEPVSPGPQPIQPPTKQPEHVAPQQPLHQATPPHPAQPPPESKGQDHGQGHGDEKDKDAH